ncbi:MAG: CpsB/CapC family capsule biosynthesis tyrosine phosphatase, partial [Saprospiraceae bacterium]
MDRITKYLTPLTRSPAHPLTRSPRSPAHPLTRSPAHSAHPLTPLTRSPLIMLNFFSNLFSKSGMTDFSVLGTDMHSHLLPGIDDGVPTLDEALEVVESLGRLGYRRLVTTPHIMW